MRSSRDWLHLFTLTTHFVAVLLLARVALAADALPAYNADIRQSSVSGISSGGFMAVQFATAWSSVIKGVGVIAGGPFYCAQASSSDILNGYMLPILTATGPCMKGPAPDVAGLIATADRMAARGDIDPLGNLAAQKIYVFHGYNDAVVARSVTDATVSFYTHYLGDANRDNLFYQTSIGAGHSQVILNQPASSGLNTCPENALPYIDQCGYDQAGVLLQHIYGRLNPRNAGAPTGQMLSFAQQYYTAPFSTRVMSLGDTGYVYVPASCAGGAACRVHIALHGCKQDYGDIQGSYITYAGYNAWADTNNIIVLYPQTQFGSGVGVAPTNPQACWDWFGYVNQDSSYVTKSGRQIQAIKAMLDALTSGGAPSVGATGTVGPSGTPPVSGLAVIDTSDVAADLAWRPVAGASAYRIYRAGADRKFVQVGSTATGASFGDAGLAPGTAYLWQVAAVVGGAEGPPSATVAATTRATPAACSNPGSC
jgi:poly(3-hydroxybutyrate) depolymerase